MIPRPLSALKQVLDLLGYVTSVLEPSLVLISTANGAQCSVFAGLPFDPPGARHLMAPGRLLLLSPADTASDLVARCPLVSGRGVGTTASLTLLLHAMGLPAAFTLPTACPAPCAFEARARDALALLDHEIFGSWSCFGTGRRALAGKATVFDFDAVASRFRKVLPVLREARVVCPHAHAGSAPAVARIAEASTLLAEIVALAGSVAESAETPARIGAALERLHRCVHYRDQGGMT